MGPGAWKEEAERTNGIRILGERLIRHDCPGRPEELRMVDVEGDSIAIQNTRGCVATQAGSHASRTGPSRSAGPPFRSRRPRRGAGSSWAMVICGRTEFGSASSAFRSYVEGGHPVACIIPNPPYPPPIVGDLRHTDRCTYLHDGMANTI